MKDAAGSRSPNARRRRRGAIVALLVLVPVLVVVLSEVVGWRYLRAPIQSLATSLVGRDVMIEAPFRLHLLRPTPSLAVGGFSIAPPDWSRASQFVASGPLLVETRWIDLLSWRGRREAPLTVATLSAQRLAIDAERTAEGRASWQFGDGKPATEPETAFALPSIERLELVDSRIKVNDALLPLALDATATLREGAQVQDAGVTIEARGQYRDSMFTITAKAPGIMPLASGGALEGLEAQAEIGRTKLRFSGRVGQPAQLQDLTGDFAIEGPTLAELGVLPGLTLPATRPYAVEGRVSRAADRIEVTVKAASVGDSRLAGEFQFDPTSKPPRLAGRLTGSRLLVRDLGPAIGGEGEGAAGKAKAPAQAKPTAAKAREARGRVLPDRRLDIPSLDQMNADVAVAIARFDPGTEMIQTMTDLRGRIVLTDGVLEVRELSTRVAGGRIEGGLRLGPAQRQSARWDMRLKWESIELAQWLKQTQQQRVAEGRFDGTLKLSGEGGSTAEMLASLDGDIRGVVRDGRISHQVIEVLGLDAAQALGVTARGDELLELRCALMDFGAEDGVLTSRAGVIDTVDSTIFIDGAVGLGNETLKLRMVAAPKDWSPLSLRSPVLVNGSFGDPDIGVDARPLALKALASLALAAVAPVAALVPLMDFGKDRGDVCAGALQRMRRVGETGGEAGNDGRWAAAEKEPVPQAGGRDAQKPEPARQPATPVDRPRDEGEPMGIR